LNRNHGNIHFLRAQGLESKSSTFDWKGGCKSNLLSDCENYFIIIRPGFPAYGKEAGFALKSAFQSRAAQKRRVDVVGDGLASISIALVEHRLRKFAMDSRKPFCILVRGHGWDGQNELQIKFGDGAWVSNAELLRAIKGAINGVSVSMLYTMRCSHAALHDAAILPHGSSLVTFSDKTAIDSDVERWINALASRYVSSTSV